MAKVLFAQNCCWLYIQAFPAYKNLSLDVWVDSKAQYVGRESSPLPTVLNTPAFPTNFLAHLQAISTNDHNFSCIPTAHFNTYAYTYHASNIGIFVLHGVQTAYRSTNVTFIPLILRHNECEIIGKLKLWGPKIYFLNKSQDLFPK